jgi:hypothetical protein
MLPLLVMVVSSKRYAYCGQEHHQCVLSFCEAHVVDKYKQLRLTVVFQNE